MALRIILYLHPYFSLTTVVKMLLLYLHEYVMWLLGEFLIFNFYKHKFQIWIFISVFGTLMWFWPHENMILKLVEHTIIFEPILLKNYPFIWLLVKSCPCSATGGIKIPHWSKYITIKGTSSCVECKGQVRNSVLPLPTQLFVTWMEFAIKSMDIHVFMLNTHHGLISI